jgi:hypothetical protein
MIGKITAATGYAPLEKWATGEWFDAIFNPITGVIGDGLFGLLVGIGVLTAFYVAGRGDLAAPTIFVMMFAPVFIGVIPAHLHGMVYALALVGIVAALLTFARQYVLEPGMQ